MILFWMFSAIQQQTPQGNTSATGTVAAGQQRPRAPCWTYSHHCQIADMKPSKRSCGTENFGGFVYVLDRFPQRDFGLWVFMCTTNVSLFCDHLYCTGYHAQGYHALTTTARLPRRALPRPILTTTGYHACVYIPISTPELPRFKQTSGYRQVITPAGSFYLFFLSSVIRLRSSFCAGAGCGSRRGETSLLF